MTVRATSLAARSSTRPARQQRARIFLFILDKGSFGATLPEIEEGTGIPGNSARPARLYLEKKGWVEDSGKTRPTKFGRQAIVWVIPKPVADKALMKLGRVL